MVTGRRASPRGRMSKDIRLLLVVSAGFFVAIVLLTSTLADLQRSNEIPERITTADVCRSGGVAN